MHYFRSRTSKGFVKKQALLPVLLLIMVLSTTAFLGNATVGAAEIIESVHHTVTFERNLPYTVPTVVTVDSGSTVARPADPGRTREQSFIGWYDENYELFDFNTPITRDITLTAHWLYRVTSSVPNETVLQIPENGMEITLTHTTTLPVEVDAEIRYRITTADGWTSAATAHTAWEIYTDPFVITEDNYRTLFAASGRWLSIEARVDFGGTHMYGFVCLGNSQAWGLTFRAGHTVTIDPNNGQTATVEIIRENNVVARPATDPTRAGYIFKGWFANGEVFNFNTQIWEETAIVAQWEAESAKCQVCGEIDCICCDKDPCVCKTTEFSQTSSAQLTALLEQGNVQLTTPGNYGISNGSVLVIPEGVTLQVATTLNVRRGATLVVDGNLVVLEGGRINNDHGADIGSGGTIIINGRLINNGYVENVSGSTVINNAVITNNGRFEVRARTTLDNNGEIIGEAAINIHRDAIIPGSMSKMGQAVANGWE